MSPPENSYVLLAERSRLSDVVGGFAGGFRQHHSRISTVELLLAALAAVGAVLLLVLAGRLMYLAWRRWRQSSVGLFWRLCRAHRLAWPDRWLLWQAAHALEFPEPAAIFVEADRLTAPPVTALFPGDAPRLVRLRERLLAEPPQREMVEVFPEAGPVLPAGPSDPDHVEENQPQSSRSNPGRLAPASLPLPPVAAKPDLANLGWLSDELKPWGGLPDSLNHAP